MDISPSKSNNKLYKCSVRGCENNNRCNPDHTFHTFPNPQTDPRKRCVYISDYFGNESKVDQLTAWLYALKIKRHHKGMRVCSRHFKREDYCFPDIQYPLKRPILMKNAVPSLNLPIADESKEEISKQRLKRRLKREALKGPSDDHFENKSEVNHDHAYYLSSKDKHGAFDSSNDCLEMDLNEPVGGESVLTSGMDHSISSDQVFPCVSLCGSEEVNGNPDSLQLFLRDIFQGENLHLAHDGSEESSDNSAVLDGSDLTAGCTSAQESMTMDNSGVSDEQSFSYAGDCFPHSPQQNEICCQNATATTDYVIQQGGEQKVHQKHSGVQVDHKFSILDMLKTDMQLSSATGIETFLLLDTIVNFMKAATDNQYETKKCTMDTRKRVIMTYLKMKQNIFYRFLSIIFGSIVCEQHCARIFVETVLMLNKIMKAIALPWPSRATIRKNLPQCFEGFENTRIVLDCTEIFIQKPQNLCCRIQVYSNYKGVDTIKFMTGVTPGGNVSYISKPYGGRYSDSAIFEQSGLVELLEAGDGVMVDKGFLIDEPCQMKKLCLIRPPFLTKKNNRKFSATEAILTASIAKARVHVERFNQRIKVFDILGGVYPISLVPIIGEVFNVVCGTVNLSSPIIDDDKFMGSKG
ncbi:hypothetical protein QAD02_003196 [Eretmocerus hayati]|uniref:Uncharacterized protein n=1 Tax=Eretmocerus hayati TaxID=131215 RepID=A0ACC2NNX3_9HYME|nr:hypothetical protein QAD02_003196 [Eretmocerus hayati]